MSRIRDVKGNVSVLIYEANFGGVLQSSFIIIAHPNEVREYGDIIYGVNGNLYYEQLDEFVILQLKVGQLVQHTQVYRLAHARFWLRGQCTLHLSTQD